MNIELDKTIEALDGKKLFIDGEQATIGKIASNALMHSSSDNYEQKAELAKKILAAEEEVSLKAEDITLIKESAKQMNYTAQLIYQFEQAIDPTDDE